MNEFVVFAEVGSQVEAGNSAGLNLTQHLLIGAFWLGGFFYLFRLLFRRTTCKVVGFWDWEAEIIHGSCMFAMPRALGSTLNLSADVWTVILCAEGTWFFIRAMTWGRKLPWVPWFGDWLHAAVLFGMARMFLDIESYALTLGLTAFWGGFVVYVIYDGIADARHRPKATEHPLKKTYNLGTDGWHLFKGIIMLVMTVWPSLLMPDHGKHRPELAAAAAKVAASIASVDDENFESEVIREKLPVVMLVFGGCERCSVEAAAFVKVSRQFSEGEVKFVKVNKDSSPTLCHKLGVNECPIVLTLKGGKVSSARLNACGQVGKMSDYVTAQIERK